MSEGCNCGKLKEQIAQLVSQVELERKTKEYYFDFIQDLRKCCNLEDVYTMIDNLEI